MIAFDRRLRWRQHKLFKLCAKLPQREKNTLYRWLAARMEEQAQFPTHRKFAIRSIIVRRTIIEHGSDEARQRVFLQQPDKAERLKRTRVFRRLKLAFAGMSIASLDR
jgi:hypothetical protein